MSSTPTPPAGIRGAIDLSALSARGGTTPADAPAAATGAAGAPDASGLPEGLLVEVTDATFSDVMNRTLKVPAVLVIWSSAHPQTVGLAERQPDGRLHVIFYGNEDGVLAGQLLLLPEGSYRLQMQVVGSPLHAEALRWSIRCDKKDQPEAIANVDQAARNGWTFQVPANCPAQRLELSGRSGDIAQQSEATIAALSLVRAGTRA